MTEVGAVMKALKAALKARGVHYAELARALDLSEASVKRCFSRQTLTLERVEKICAVLEIDLLELVKLSRREQETQRFLRLDQERLLATDAQLLSLFHLVANGWTYAEIRTDFDISERALSRQLARLDRGGLIELGPRNRLRLRAPARFEWRANGPVKRRHAAAAIGEFMTSPFSGRDELLRLDVRELSDASLAKLQRRVERVASEFQQFAEMDSTLPAQRRDRCSWAHWRCRRCSYPRHRRLSRSSDRSPTR